MTLSEKIAYCRKKAMLSQEALAEKLGVSRQAVSKWETGESVPELNKMAALAKELNTSVDWLLSPDAPAEDPEPAQQAEPAAAYPGWIDKMPGFFQKAFYRWGWLYGVYVAISGGFFAAFGILMKVVSSAFTNSVSQTWESFGSGFEFGTVGGFGTVSGFGTVDPFGGMDTMMNPVELIANFVIGIGLLVLIAGIVLAIVLRRYGKSKE